MVSFDLSFRSMLIEDIVEDKISLLTGVIFLWLSINRGSYHGKRVQVVDGAFCPFVGFLSGAAYCRACSQSVLSIWLPFCVF